MLQCLEHLLVRGDYKVEEHLVPCGQFIFLSTMHIRCPLLLSLPTPEGVVSDSSLPHVGLLSLPMGLICASCFWVVGKKMQEQSQRRGLGHVGPAVPLCLQFCCQFICILLFFSALFPISPQSVSLMFVLSGDVTKERREGERVSGLNPRGWLLCHQMNANTDKASVILQQLTVLYTSVRIYTALSQHTVTVAPLKLSCFMSIFIFIGLTFAAAANDILSRLILSHRSDVPKCIALFCKYKCCTVVIFSAGDRMTQQHLNTEGMSWDLQSVTFE